MIAVEKTQLEGVLKIVPDLFKDHRGAFVETYSEKLYREQGVEIDFVQDDISRSKKDVLRGIHGDAETAKLVSCIYGELFFVVVNCKEDSPGFGKWQSFDLTDKNRIQIFAPSGFGMAYLVRSEEAIFTYKQSTYFVPGRQFTYRWDDPRFKIEWPITNPILSARDTNGDYA